MTAPPYNGPQTGFSAGNWDNVTVLEYNCVTNQYEPNRWNQPEYPQVCLE